MAKMNEKYETAPLNPGWIKKRVPDNYADDNLKRIIIFYVINTPCIGESSSSIPMSEYGWRKDVWKKHDLKNALFSIAGLRSNETFFAVAKLSDLKSLFEKAKMKKGFHEHRDVEKIVIYKTKKYPNEMLSVFHHIRNSFAHGRLAMYKYGTNDVVFVLEDGIEKRSEFQVRSRMIIKKSTLLKWIDIIEAGPDKLNESEEKAE